MRKTILLCFIHGFKVRTAWSYLNTTTSSRGVEADRDAGRRRHIRYIPFAFESTPSTCAAQGHDPRNHISEVRDKRRPSRVRRPLQGMAAEQSHRPRSRQFDSFADSRSLSTYDSHRTLYGRHCRRRDNSVHNRRPACLLAAELANARRIDWVAVRDLDPHVPVHTRHPCL